MPQLGFIRSKNEIKFLILYIAERLLAPVPIEVMQNLVLSSDGAIEFFDFSECLGYLVQTEHLTLSDDGLYAITEKGILNGRATAIEIPYSVRLHAEDLVKAQNQKIKRARQVQVSTYSQSNGNTAVTLRFNDDHGLTLWRMDVAVPDEKYVRKLRKRFEQDAEKIYSEVISILFREDKSEENE
ncbi:MAG: DUF4364 family protein [Oscillospiraceae bacterium]|nr:DUF4364 family protein [Oscillospiraceae bacterium]